MPAVINQDCHLNLILKLLTKKKKSVRLLGTLNENKNTSVEVLESVDDLRCLDSHRVMECRRRSWDLSFLANFARSLATVNQEKLTIKSYSLLDTYNRLGCFKNPGSIDQWWKMYPPKCTPGNIDQSWFHDWAMLPGVHFRGYSFRR